MSHPRAMLGHVERVPATRFAAMVRVLAAECREIGLTVPAFRSPPRLDRTRSIRRVGGGAVVAVRLRDRTPEAVAEDMVEGVVVANGLDVSTAAAVRRRLQAALTPVEIDLTVEPGAGRSLEPRARVAERQTQAA